MGKEANKAGLFLAGIDYREECPKVCYRTEQMREPQPLPLDFGGETGRGACFRRILSALRRYGRKEALRTAVILPELSEEGIRRCIKEACEAGFSEDRLSVMGETESVAHFVMHQTGDIWQQKVWLLEFGAEEVKASSIVVNKRTVPMVVKAEEPEYWHTGSLADGNRDERLVRYVKERFGRERVSAVFLTGTDLNAGDYPKSREEICFRRRVFLGDQIHARGACMAAGEAPGERPYLYLGEQTLLYNVGIRSSRGGTEEIYTIVDAGVNWYEANGSCEVLLLEEPLLEFSFQSMLGGEPIRGGMMLSDLPRRPEGACRLLVEVHFPAPAQCEIKVTDLGFGELYPSSDLYWIESFVLEEADNGSSIHL